MTASALPERPRGVALLLGWPRLRFTLLMAFALSLLLGMGWKDSWFSLFQRVLAIGVCALIAFGTFEQWPRRLPRFVARWVLQVLAVAAMIPFATIAIYVASTEPGAPMFLLDRERVAGFALLTVTGLLFTPWIALGALVRQKDAMARQQALVFDLERSELERKALDARLHLLQAQVAPHFLFNTLANVQALVDSGSPRASAVLGSLVAYLRASVPRLHDTASSIGQELQLVQAYHELMHMRMPDRLQFALHVDEAALGLRCPPLTLLTLVENAVRHGIDPGEEGGRIDIHVERRDGRCRVRVLDSGVGLRDGVHGLGTGLSTLRERLQLSFGGDATLRVEARSPQGVGAEIDMPAREARP